MKQFGPIVSIVAVAMFLATVGDALAKKRGSGSRFYETNIITKRPIHGYTGLAGPTNNYFCGYYRIPIRKCEWRRGRERCKVVAWNLKQFCY